MKATITVHIPEGSKIVVKEGDDVFDNTLLAKIDEEEEMSPLLLAKLLNIKPPNIPKYLNKRIGDDIFEGDIIATKKTFFSSVSVKSPYSGKLLHVDLKSGSVTIETRKSAPKKIISPVKGKVSKISEKIIEIETDATVYTGIKGEGEKTRGKLQFVTEGEAGVMNGKTEISSGAIALLGSITEAALVKYDVLGILGLVLAEEPSIRTLPYLIVEKNIFTKISHHDGEMAILDPREKRIYFLNQ